MITLTNANNTMSKFHFFNGAKMKNFTHHFFAYGYVVSGALGGIMLHDAFVNNNVAKAVWAMIIIFANMLANSHYWED